MLNNLSIQIPLVQIPDGKPENVFAFAGECKSKKYTVEVLLETHEQWKKLMSGQSPNKTADYDLCM